MDGGSGDAATDHGSANNGSSNDATTSDDCGTNDATAGDDCGSNYSASDDTSHCAYDTSHIVHEHNNHDLDYDHKHINYFDDRAPSCLYLANDQRAGRHPKFSATATRLRGD